MQLLGEHCLMSLGVIMGLSSEGFHSIAHSLARRKFASPLIVGLERRLLCSMPADNRDVVHRQGLMESCPRSPSTFLPRDRGFEVAGMAVCMVVQEAWAGEEAQRQRRALDGRSLLLTRLQHSHNESAAAI